MEVAQLLLDYGLMAVYAPFFMRHISMSTIETKTWCATLEMRVM